MLLWLVFPPINLKSIDLHPLYSLICEMHKVLRQTNLEQSAAAGPFPLCRTAHASFDPENYLKSTEGHVRWKLSDIVEINLKTHSWIQRTRELLGCEHNSENTVTVIFAVPFKCWNSLSNFFLSSTCSTSCFCNSSAKPKVKMCQIQH